MSVSTRFIGRLGNSCFQLAACIGYAKKYGYAWAAPHDARESSIHRVFPNLPKCHPSGNTYPRRDGYDPQYTDYHDIPNVGGDVLLAGFFQSWKYFAHCEEEVKKVFQLDHYPEYEGCISIHVRRGDYVQYADSFPPITEQYIIDAMRQIFRKGIDWGTKLVVFSDDIQWCKDLMGDWRRTIEFSEGVDERTDLSRMASCSHHIIANSSFSWWGAYLGHNPSKIVVCPSRLDWYGPNNGCVKWYKENGKEILPDMIPDNWIQIRM